VVTATALTVVRWKPSAGSRSLSGIFSLEQPHRAALARIGPAQATPASGPRPHLALPVRQETYSVESATDHSTSIQPVKPDVSWRTERARAAGGDYWERSRLSDLYPRECGAVLLFELGYVAERPRAARRLSTLTDECGAVRNISFFHDTSTRNELHNHSLNISPDGTSVP